jgi:hypothetical protein
MVSAREQQFVGAQRARTTLVDLARRDPSTFCGFVLRDEENGKPIEQHDIHHEWHDLVTEHPRLVVWSAIEHGKTQQLSIGRVLWELGRNPNLRIVIVSNTAEQAKKIIRSIAQYIEKSEELHAVFPRLRPSSNRTLPWSSTQLTVERAVISKDPSVQAFGLHGNITGQRVDMVVADDVLDPENTATEAQMKATWMWFKRAIIGRLTADSKFVMIGNAWHPHDAMHQAAALPRFVSRTYSVYEDREETVIRWPERWPPARLEATKLDLGPLEFARQLLCKARDDEQARFKQEWIDLAIERGEGYSLVPEIGRLPPGFVLYVGADLSIGKTGRKGDKTVFFAILRWTDGTRQILWVESGRLKGPEIVRRIEELDAALGGLFVVENNAAQHYIIQFSEELNAAAIIPFTTGKNKADPTFGVEGIAAELAAGKWIIPSRGGKPLNAELHAFVEALLYYDPNSHTPDHLMAAWFAREGCRAFERRGKSGKRKGGGCRVIG